MEGGMMSDMRSMSEGRGSTEVMTFIAGAIVGAAAALLLAPYSGNETRRKLSETARRLQDNAKSTLHDVRERFDHTKEDVREAVAEGRDAYARSSRSHKSAPTESPLSRENL
jgi:gas vesicle protein